MIKIIKYTCHFILIFLIFATHTRAQEVDTLLRHRLYISSAFKNTNSRDEQGSPLLYSGSSYPLLLGYEYRGNSYRHQFQLSFELYGINANNLIPDLPDDPLDRKCFFAYSSFSYSYLRDWIETMKGHLQWSFGLMLDNVVFIRNYKYFGGDLYSTQGAATWEELNMLSPVVRADYQLNRNAKLYSQLSIPIISLVARPGYNLWNSNSSAVKSTNFHVVFIGGLLEWNYSLTYEQRIWDALLVSASYNSRYYRYTRYDWTTAVFMQDLALNLIWRFGL